ncbi:putative ABC transport system permease protein [Conyzicola lurida]|uniref:Putative ABC transport system permease protein n=1 Tax=Conyzicola lurida TaxID=1172621 RepID=A0A841ANM2_9MICO|nr:FtsX-like permease family protein [Conyzicola lurida]MBB5843019.1 putative ABC transport system permease protein [Conyzicola lurida]
MPHRTTLGPARIARRAAGAFAGLAAMVAIVTVLMALLATGLPRAVDGILAAGVRYETESTPATQIDLGADLPPGSVGWSWSSLDTDLEALRDGMPEPLRSTLSPAEFLTVAAPAPYDAETQPDAALSVAYDPRVLSRITLVEGDEPARVDSRELPSEEPLDVVASTVVADRLEWVVGDTRQLALPDRLTQLVRLSGTFEPVDADDAYWEHTSATLEPAVDSRTLPPVITATVYANPAVLAAAQNSLVTNLHTAVWYPTATDALDGASAAEVAQQTRKFVSSTQRVGGAAVTFESGLPEVLDAAADRTASSQSILATIVAGPLGVALAIEILIARLAASRLRESLALIEARGASLAQRRLVLLVPALVVGVVAAAAGAAVGFLVPAAPPGVPAILAIVVTAVLPAALIAAFATGRRERAGSVTRSGLWRVIGEVVVVLASAASLTAILQRTGTTTATGSIDLLAAATPLVLTLLGCVVALRIYPLLLRRVVAASHRGPGISAFYGTARALRGGGAGLVPVLTVVVGVSVAVFSGVLSATLATGLDDAARTRVGADVSVREVRLEADAVDRVRAVDGVEAVAAVAQRLNDRLSYEGGSPVTLTLLLVDAEELAAVQRGVPGALDLGALRRDGAEPLTIAVSAGVAATTRDATEARLDFVDVDIVPPAIDANPFRIPGRFVVADDTAAETLSVAQAGLAQQLLVRLDPGADVDAVTTDIRALVGDDAIVETPGDAAAVLAENPAVGGIRTAALLAIVGAGILTTAALVLTTVLDGRTRRDDIALLSTLGLRRRQARAAVIWELAPLSVVGLVVGVLLGAGLSALVLGTVDLRPFTAGLVQPAVTIDPLLSAVIVGGFVVVLATTAVAAAQAATRSRADTGQKNTRKKRENP